MYEIFERLCKMHDVTLYKVGKETGIARSTLSDWKNGKSTPKQDKLKKIADYFGVTVDYLLGSENYVMDKETNTWEYVIPKKDMDILVKAMSDKENADRLIAYAKKLIEIKNMENI